VAVTRNQVLLDTPIKTIGLYDVKIALHPEVTVTIKVNVARTAEEAEAQAQGAVLTGPVSDRAEARAAAQALLEEEDRPRRGRGPTKRKSDKNTRPPAWRPWRPRLRAGRIAPSTSDSRHRWPSPA
jgi:ribosomal protein L19E